MKTLCRFPKEQFFRKTQPSPHLFSKHSTNPTAPKTYCCSFRVTAFCLPPHEMCLCPLSLLLLQTKYNLSSLKRFCFLPLRRAKNLSNRQQPPQFSEICLLCRPYCSAKKLPCLPLSSQQTIANPPQKTSP